MHPSCVNGHTQRHYIDAMYMHEAYLYIAYIHRLLNRVWSIIDSIPICIFAADTQVLQ